MYRSCYTSLSILSIISLCINHLDAGCCNYTSKSFFEARPQFSVASPEVLSLWHSTAIDEKPCSKGTLQIVPFGGVSTNAKKLGTYFMPFCSNSADVTSTTVPNSSTSLFAQNFNIPALQYDLATLNAGLATIAGQTLTSPFSSTIKISPQQAVFGVGFSYQYDFCVRGKEYWIRLITPIEYVRNNMHLDEKITNTQIYSIVPIAGTNLADPQASMSGALSQEQWLYGTIDNSNHSKVGLSFIQLQLAQVSINKEDYFVSPYIGIDIPTGTQVRSERVFEPVVGNGRHFGIFWGFESEMFAWRDKCNKNELTFCIDINMEYLFKATQHRSLDLKGRPWSRYIETYASQAQATQAALLVSSTSLPTLQGIFLDTPGINILTQKVNVTPGFNFITNLALTFGQQCPCGFDAEVGYNFYAKQAECVSLKDPFNTTAAIKDPFGTGLANPARTITEEAFTDDIGAVIALADPAQAAMVRANYNTYTINESDLDLQSAAHPCTLSNIIYATFGYHWNNRCHPVSTVFGISYEFNGKFNGAMDRVLLWTKAGVSF